MVLLAGPILKGHEFRGDVHQRGERDAVRRRVDRVRGVQGLPLLLYGRPGVHGTLLLAGKQALTLTTACTWSRAFATDGGEGAG